MEDGYILLDIDIKNLKNFAEYPFNLSMDEKMKQLLESIVINGIITSLIVRKGHEGYEIISGHRRKYIAKILNIKKLLCIVKEMNNKEAILAMVDSNIYRENITYGQAKKKLNQELEIVKTNNEHEINRLVEEHKINIEDLEKKHKLEMEAKEKEYEHEKEILELKSRTSINEKSQEAMNTAMSGVMGNIFNGILSGKIDTDKINEISKKFSPNNNK